MFSHALSLFVSQLSQAIRINIVLMEISNRKNCMTSLKTFCHYVMENQFSGTFKYLS